jgi:hypothetical protein
MQVHCPLEPHSPLIQLQLDGGFVTIGDKQRPVPDNPSSQEVHPEGHAWHVGPKKPVAQDSQDEPVKPLGHEHVPAAEQTPFPEQGGEQDDDCRLSNDMDPDALAGSWLTSGIEFHNMTRLLPPADTAAQTFPERATEDAVSGIDVFPTGDVGRPEYEPCPE